MSGAPNFSNTDGAAGQQDYNALLAQAMANAQQQQTQQPQQPQQAQPQQQQQMTNDAQDQPSPLYAAIQQQQQQAFMVAMNAAAMLQQQQQQQQQQQAPSMQEPSTGSLPPPQQQQLNMMMPPSQVPAPASQQAPASAPQQSPLPSQQQPTMAPLAASSQQQQQPTSFPQATAATGVSHQEAPQLGTFPPGMYAATGAQQYPQYYGGMMGQMGAVDAMGTNLSTVNNNNVLQQQPMMGIMAGDPQQQMDPNTAMAMDPNTMLALQQFIVAQQQQAGAAMNPWMQAYQQQVMDYQNQQQQSAALFPLSMDGGNAVPSGLDVPAVKLKQAPKRKPKDRPKRPLSAYNFFFKEERARILDDGPSEKRAKTDDDAAKESDKKENPVVEGVDENHNVSDEVVSYDNGTNSRKRKKGPPHRKIGFESLAKTIGKRWKELGPNDLEYYKGKANEDLLRYKKEMETYLAKQREDSQRKVESMQGAAGGTIEAKGNDNGSAGVVEEEEQDGKVEV